MVEFLQITDFHSLITFCPACSPTTSYRIGTAFLVALVISFAPLASRLRRFATGLHN